MQVEVARATDGRVWEVRRRGVQWRGPKPEVLDEWLEEEVGDPNKESVDTIVGWFLFLLLFVIVGVMIFVFLPLIAFLAEAAALLFGAYVLRRPWVVEASTVGPPAETRVWKVRGRHASKRAVREIARQLRATGDATA